MEGFFALALDLNVSIDFLHDKFLTLEELSGYKTLLVPTKPIIGERTAGLLRDYVKQGGTIVVESRLGRFKGNGYVCGDPPHGLQDVFGCKTVAIFREDNVKIGLKDGVLEGRYEWEYYEPTTGEVLGRNEKNGSPAVIRSTYGKGSTLLIGTNIGQEYSITRNEAMRKFLSPYLTSEMSVENIVSPTTFSVRLVHCKEKDVLFLMNFGDNHEKPTVRMEQAYARIQDIETDEILGTAVKDISIKVPPKTAKILLLDR